MNTNGMLNYNEIKEIEAIVGMLDYSEMEEIQAFKDQRPDPKPRKHAELWQAYLIWNEYVQSRKRHILRLGAIERGKSNMNADVERILLLGLTKSRDDWCQQMINLGEQVGPIWFWLTSIKGLGAGSLAAQLLAQIDDPGKFKTISKLWAFAGYKVVDGRRQYLKPGEVAPYNRRLKSTCWLIVDQFVRQRTPVYREIYDDEKAHLRSVHPKPIKENGRTLYNDGHIDNMARRKAAKIFLSHIWVTWRKSEGLPVSEPYAQAILGHTNIIQPEEVVSL